MGGHGSGRKRKPVISGSPRSSPQSSPNPFSAKAPVNLYYKPGGALGARPVETGSKTPRKISRSSEKYFGTRFVIMQLTPMQA